MTQKAGEDLFFFGLHFKFGWRFCKAETPLKISRSTTAFMLQKKYF